MIVVYGVTGFTGRLVLDALVAAGRRPVAAGRRAAAVRAATAPHGLDLRVGGLDDLDLTGATVLLNAAGPFGTTGPPLAAACLRAGVHYLDLAGEVPEHAALRALDADARAAGVALVPGVGFGIVPSAGLAAHVCARVEAPRSVQLALKTTGGVSRGTAEVVLGGLRTPGVRRAGGRLEPRRAGAARLDVDFADGDGPTTVVTNPWRADLAAVAPEVADMEAFMAFPAPVRALMRVPHGGLLRAVARRLPEGPDAAALDAGRSAIWARATGADGATATAVLHGPDAYRFSAATAALCAGRALDGDVTPDFHTPDAAWGSDLALEVAGVERVDLP